MKIVLLFLCLHGNTLWSVSAPSVEGRWYDERGGIYLVKQKNERFAWFGQGLQGGRYQIHRGTGTVNGSALEADWTEMPGSEFYPRKGSGSGVFEQGGKTIRWDKELPFKVWTRKPPAKVDSGLDDPSGELTDEERRLLEGDIDLGGNGDGDDADPWDIAGSGDDDDDDDGNVVGGDPVGRPDPWNDPEVQRKIDYWLANAKPPASQRLGGRYNEYGQYVNFQGYTYSRPPDDVARIGRYHYLWNIAETLPSLNLGTLMDYIMGRLPTGDNSDWDIASGPGDNSGSEGDDGGPDKDWLTGSVNNGDWLVGSGGDDGQGTDPGDQPHGNKKSLVGRWNGGNNGRYQLEIVRDENGIIEIRNYGFVIMRKKSSSEKRWELKCSNATLKKVEGGYYGRDIKAVFTDYFKPDRPNNMDVVCQLMVVPDGNNVIRLLKEEAFKHVGYKRDFNSQYKDPSRGIKLRRK